MIDLEVDYHENEAIQGLNLSNGDLSGREFYRCAFAACNLTEADLSRSVFEDCVFRESNLSNPLIAGSRLLNVEFLDCKIVGLNFYHCDQLLFECGFSKTHLQNCNFSDLKMKRASFIGCRIDECDFENAFLVEARFDDSVFRQTLFHGCDLTGASFLEAKGYGIDPRNNIVKKATFSVPDVLALVECFGVEIKNRD
jgi:uncharacterized protein YjbI with pentapeptide repeats